MMLKNITILFFSLFILNNVNAQKIYEEKSLYLADFTVYVTKNRALADLYVFKVNSMAYAKGNKGRWYFVNSRYLADKTVYFVNSRYQADITIFYVNSISLAGWRKKQNKCRFE